MSGLHGSSRYQVILGHKCILGHMGHMDRVCFESVSMGVNIHSVIGIITNWISSTAHMTQTFKVRCAENV